jgi:hypothetical protein
VQWSETGDRYMLKLFRDYIFHQMTANGQPWIDLSHIIQCLNKVRLSNARAQLFNLKISIFTHHLQYILSALVVCVNKILKYDEIQLKYI